LALSLGGAKRRTSHADEHGWYEDERDFGQQQERSDRWRERIKRESAQGLLEAMAKSQGRVEFMSLLLFVMALLNGDIDETPTTRH